MDVSGPPVVENPLLLLDYDGTLSEIRVDPREAYPEPEVVSLLKELQSRHPVWIVTGRHLKDVSGFLGLELPAIGLHGMQKGILCGKWETRISASAIEAIRGLRSTFPDPPDTWVEEKEKTFAVHYLGAKNKQALEAQLKKWLGKLPESIEAAWGKGVVELRPRGLNKGVVVREVLKNYSGRVPVYIGDDVSDETVFPVLGATGISIKVGQGETTAQFRLKDIPAVIDYLGRYITQ